MPFLLVGVFCLGQLEIESHRTVSERYKYAELELSCCTVSAPENQEARILFCRALNRFQERTSVVMRLATGRLAAQSSKPLV